MKIGRLGGKKGRFVGKNEVLFAKKEVSWQKVMVFGDNFQTLTKTIIVKFDYFHHSYEPLESFLS